MEAAAGSGIKTFARCPHVSEPDGVDVAVVGVPFDTATSFRAGARFAPEAIRAGSALLRPYRLGRLEQLLGVSLKQPAAITALYVALMAGERSRG